MPGVGGSRLSARTEALRATIRNVEGEAAPVRVVRTATSAKRGDPMMNRSDPARTGRVRCEEWPIGELCGVRGGRLQRAEEAGVYNEALWGGGEEV